MLTARQDALAGEVVAPDDRAMLALGFLTRYAGLDATMGLAFASTGVLFPFVSPLLSWLGVALTGSDTSSNVPLRGSSGSAPSGWG